MFFKETKETVELIPNSCLVCNLDDKSKDRKKKLFPPPPHQTHTQTHTVRQLQIGSSLRSIRHSQRSSFRKELFSKNSKNMCQENTGSLRYESYIGKHGVLSSASSPPLGWRGAFLAPAAPGWGCSFFTHPRQTPQALSPGTWKYMRLFPYIKMPNQQCGAGESGSACQPCGKGSSLGLPQHGSAQVYKKSKSVAQIIVLQNWERITKYPYQLVWGLS